MKSAQSEFAFLSPKGEEQVDSYPKPAQSRVAKGVPMTEVVEVEPVAEAMVHRRAERRREGTPVPDDGALTTYADRGRFRKPLAMGRFLTLSGSLDGDRGPVRRFKLPRQPGFVAKLRLWNEPPCPTVSYRDLRFPPRELSSHGPRRADGNLII